MNGHVGADRGSLAELGHAVSTPSRSAYGSFVNAHGSRLSKCFVPRSVNGELSFLMEAHDSLTATIAQRSKFKALSASGSSIESSLGVAMPMKLHGASSFRASNA